MHVNPPCGEPPYLDPETAPGLYFTTDELRTMTSEQREWLHGQLRERLNVPALINAMHDCAMQSGQEKESANVNR